MKTVYDFTVKDRQGSDVSLSEYRGKVLLIVNTATGCGFTPHYEPLEAMYRDLKDKGLEILDFPCNQFANQAPGSDDEIHDFCTIKFGTEFPQFKKIDVNGETADPLYALLASEKPFTGFGSSATRPTSAGTSPNSSSTARERSLPVSSPPTTWPRSARPSKPRCKRKNSCLRRSSP